MIRGKGTIDGVQYESDTTFAVALTYFGFAPTEVAGSIVLGGFAPETTKAELVTAFEAALQAALENDHGFVFDVGDTVEIFGL